MNYHESVAPKCSCPRCGFVIEREHTSTAAPMHGVGGHGNRLATDQVLRRDMHSHPIRNHKEPVWYDAKQGKRRNDSNFNPRNLP